MKRIISLPIFQVLLLGFLLAISNSCNTEVDPKLLPVLTTSAVTKITQNTATTGGSISSDGGVEVSARGVVWSLKPNPTIKDSLSKDAAGTGEFTSSLKNLLADTTYYVRAYATNKYGTAYGLQLTFRTLQAILAPTLTTTLATNITASTATSGGNITFDGRSAITLRGVCWSIKTNPTIADSKTSDGTGLGSFTSAIKGLTPGTTYYLRAYATNVSGTGYGEAKSFSTPFLITFNPNLTYGSVTDIDGNVYKTITIGTQTWMAENLRTSKYRNGVAIPIVTDRTSWRNLTTGACCYYLNDATNVLKFGKLYNGYAATDSRNIAPLGWHLPTDAEWTKLITFLGGESSAGGKLKEVGTYNWSNPNTGANNASGFSALPSSYRLEGGVGFGQPGEHAFWWSSSLLTKFLHCTTSSIYTEYHSYSDIGCSVRCVKD